MSLMKTLTQGGQVTLHNIRMLKQVLHTTLLLSLLAGTVFWGGKTWRDHTPYERYAFYAYHLASWHLTKPLSIKDKETQGFESPSGKKSIVRSVDVYRHPGLQKMAQKVTAQAWFNARISLVFMGFFFALMCAFWIWRGRVRADKDILSGTEIVAPETLKRLIQKQGQASELTLAGVPLLKGKEVQHLLIAGTTGSGKTNGFHELLQQIRAQKQRAIIVDITGGFVEKYYRPERDILLSPLDARSEKWNVWAEGTEPYHFDALAAALIPQQGKDPFWANAAQSILSCAMRRLHAQEKLSMHELLDITIRRQVQDFQEFFQGTEAAALVDVRSKETLASIRATLTINAKCLTLLEETEAPFSLTKWIHDDAIHDSWMFLAAPPEMRDSMRPLLSAWTSIVTKALLSATPSSTRRIWLVIDELPALNKLPDLHTLLAEGRKYGGCVVLGTQDLSLLDETYGPNLVRSIANLCSTKVLFRISGSDVAKRMSEWLGTQETSEASESISYGAHQMRDGISLSDVRREKPCVTPDQLMKLPDLTGYLKLPGTFPLAAVTFQYHNVPTIAKAFVKRESGGADSAL